MSVGDYIKNEINGKVKSGLGITNSMRTLRSTTIGGYRSTHSIQTFRFGRASGFIYVIGDNDNYTVQ